MLLAKTKLTTVKVLISKAFIDPYINHDELVSLNNMLREYNEIKQETKTPKNAVEETIRKELKSIVSAITNTVNQNHSVRKTKQNRLMLLSNCAVFDKKKSMFFINQEASKSGNH